MSSKIGNISKLLSANIIAQVVGMLIYPLLTRMYQPDDFTLLSLFLTIANALIIVSTGDLQYAIPLPKKEEGAYALVGVMVISLSSTVIISMAASFFYDKIAIFFGMPNLEWALWYLPIYISAIGVWQVLAYLFNRNKKYGKIATYQIVQSSSNAGLKVAFGIFSVGGLALIDASVIGPLIALAIIGPSKIKEVISYLRHIPTHLAKEYLSTYRSFPLYSMPKNLICHLSNGLPVLMLTSVYGATNVGYFSLAITIGYLPLAMIASSIYQVLLRNTSEKVNEYKPIFPEIHQFFFYATTILCFVFSILYFILPSITEFLFGPGWGMTGEILGILLPWLATSFIANALVFVPEVLLRLKNNLIIELSFIVLRILALAYGISHLSFIATIKLFCVISFAIKLFQAVWFLWIAKQHDKNQSIEEESNEQQED